MAAEGVRIPPLPAQEWDDHAREALARLVPRAQRTPEGAGGAMSTLVRHPNLTKAFLAFGTYIMFESTLEPRIQEIITLSVAAQRGSGYIWAHHVGSGRRAGLDDAEIEGIRRGNLPDPFEQTLLDSVVELNVRGRISDASWAALVGTLDERQCIDLVFTIGYYDMLANAYNTFGVQLDHHRDDMKSHDTWPILGGRHDVPTTE